MLSDRLRIFGLKSNIFLTNRVKLMNLYPDIKRVIRSGSVRFSVLDVPIEHPDNFDFESRFYFLNFVPIFPLFPHFIPIIAADQEISVDFGNPPSLSGCFIFFSFLLLVCFDNNENWLRMIERLFRMIWKRPDLHTIHMFSWLFKNFHECGTIFSTFMFMYILNFV